MSTDKVLSDTYGILQFTSLNHHKFYAEYNPIKTTLKQIRETLLLNYSCRAQDTIPDENIMLKLECGWKLVDLFDEDQNVTIGDVFSKYKILNDYTSIKNINITYVTWEIVPRKLTEEEKTHLDKNGFSIFVRTLNGKNITIRGLDDMKVAMLKNQIEEKEGIPANQQALIYMGKRLENNMILGDHGVKDCSTLHLVLRLSGGMYHETSGKNGNYGKLNELMFKITPDID